VKISGGGQTICFIADLFPTRHHLSLPWIMAYDLYPLQTLETKRKWLADIVRNQWIVVFGHDPDVPVAKLSELNGKIEYQPVDLNASSHREVK
jgi:glyoxylase-like metal-dependent hydrolase (beta-lactamase superfamily II)